MRDTNWFKQAPNRFRNQTSMEKPYFCLHALGPLAWPGTNSLAAEPARNIRDLASVDGMCLKGRKSYCDGRTRPVCPRNDSMVVEYL
jgi:hypothetical protein